MELESSFLKRADGQIDAVLRVVREGDYPTKYIFNNLEDWPEKNCYVLRGGRPDNAYTHIQSICNSPEEAETWVETQVEDIRRSLQQWRNLRIPRSKTWVI